MKIVHKLIALLLVPCLVGEPAAAQIVGAALVPAREFISRGSHPNVLNFGPTQGRPLHLFASQALALELLSKQRSEDPVAAGMEESAAQRAAYRPSSAQPAVTDILLTRSRSRFLLRGVKTAGILAGGVVVGKIAITAYDLPLGLITCVILGGVLLTRWISMNEKVSALLSGELKAMRPFFIRSTLLFSLVSGVWNYGLDWRLFLHDVHRAGSKSVYYLFDMSKWKPIPGSGTVRESKGFVHYHLAGSQISYDILKVPLASTSRYQIRMRTYEDIHGGRSLQDYLDQTPGAVAAAGANYISAYAHLSAPDSSPHAPAGLVVSQGRVRHAFDSFLTTYPGAGEGIVGLSKTGELLFLRSPRESSQTTALIAQLQEAAQVGPRLIWPDQNGTAQIARGLTAWFPNEIGFIMEDGKGNLYLGIEQAPLTGMLQPKTHLDVAKQIMSWSNAVGADIRYALAVEAGGYKALGTQGLFNPDLHINHAFPASSHVSLLMIVDTQPKELKIRGSDHRTHRREKGSA